MLISKRRDEGKRGQYSKERDEKIFFNILKPISQPAKVIMKKNVRSEQVS